MGDMGDDEFHGNKRADSRGAVRSFELWYMLMITRVSSSVVLLLQQQWLPHQVHRAL